MLIKCPDCGRNISSDAPICPYCGCSRWKIKAKGRLMRIGTIILMIFLGLFIYNDKKGASSKSEVATESVSASAQSEEEEERDYASEESDFSTYDYAQPTSVGEPSEEEAAAKGSVSSASADVHDDANEATGNSSEVAESAAQPQVTGYVFTGTITNDDGKSSNLVIEPNIFSNGSVNGLSEHVGRNYSIFGQYVEESGRLYINEQGGGRFDGQLSESQYTGTYRDAEGNSHSFSFRVRVHKQ